MIAWRKPQLLSIHNFPAGQNLTYLWLGSDTFMICLFDEVVMKTLELGQDHKHLCFLIKIDQPRKNCAIKVMRWSLVGQTENVSP